MRTKLPSRALNLGAPGSRVTRLELFYDLVFVFAFLNVSSLTEADFSVQGLVEALLVLSLLWWCWSGFAALGNILRADQGVMPLLGFGVMAAVFVLALSTDTAFRKNPGSFDGLFVFACAYTLMWVILIAALWSTVPAQRGPRLRSLVLAVPMVLGVALIVVGAIVPQRLFTSDVADNVRIGCWALALLVEYAVGLLLGRTGWRLRSMGHWAERHALIVLIALGESVLALGVGATNRNGRPISASVVVAAMLGIAVIAALWWLYFDVLASRVEQILHGVRGPERIPAARDVYTYLHLPLVIGVILFALGLERLLGGIINRPEATAHSAVGGLDVVILLGGVVLYLLALVAVELRVSGRVDVVLATSGALLVVLIPVAGQFPALIGLAMLAVVTVATAVVQLAAKRGVRRRVRDLIQQEQDALEAAASQWRQRYL
ncbi:low temperature requirement protein A [Micromonospora globbae]|uniref:Low temperature requirement protein A n=1 Tax=Micromonospora globbae TaxID=1894969 RepID=A0A420F8S5_9ACTN|nr:low temperature requirement protein A [Micromonospora globbae]RKF29350.1 low temperature requirement protein A [Micromonospora globbae]